MTAEGARKRTARGIGAVIGRYAPERQTGSRIEKRHTPLIRLHGWSALGIDVVHATV
jgi:hypothetical protein